jgi:hypothetical protein
MNRSGDRTPGMRGNLFGTAVLRVECNLALSSKPKCELLISLTLASYRGTHTDSLIG